MAVALARGREQLAEAAASWGGALCADLLRPNIAWLMSAKPGGVKLHAELTFLLGVAATAAVDAAEAIYTHAWPGVAAACMRALVAACALLGLCGGLAAASDLIWALLMPLEAAHAILAATYRLHLRCMGAMWRLMRGRGGAEAAAAVGAARLRSLRGRGVRHAADPRAAAAEAGARQPQPAAAAATAATAEAAAAAPQPAAAALWGNNARGADDSEVTAEHVIVGVLLFTPLLALLPTTAAWSLLTALLRWGAAAARGALLGAAALATRNPVCAVARRVVMPAAYPGGC